MYLMVAWNRFAVRTRPINIISLFGWVPMSPVFPKRSDAANLTPQLPSPFMPVTHCVC